MLGPSVRQSQREKVRSASAGQEGRLDSPFLLKKPRLDATSGFSPQLQLVSRFLPPRFTPPNASEPKSAPHDLLQQKFSGSYLSFAKKPGEKETDTAMLPVTNFLKEK